MIKMVDKNGKEFFECTEAEARVVKKKILNKRNNNDYEKDFSIFRNPFKGLTKNQLEKDVKAIIKSKFNEMQNVSDKLICNISDGFMVLESKFIIVDYVICSYITYGNIRKQLKDDSAITTNDENKELLSIGLFASIFKAKLVVTKELDDKTILISGIDEEKNNKRKVVKLSI